MTTKTVQFTPGPWSLCNWMVGNNTPTGEVTICGPEGDEHICTMDGNEDNQANANLIAAAPAMYEALRQALTTIEQTLSIIERNKIRDNVLNALAQAEGR